MDRVPELAQRRQDGEIDAWRRRLTLDDPAVKVLVGMGEQVLKGVQFLRAKVARVLVHEGTQDEVRLAETAPPSAE